MRGDVGFVHGTRVRYLPFSESSFRFITCLLVLTFIYCGHIIVQGTSANESYEGRSTYQPMGPEGPWSLPSKQVLNDPFPPRARRYQGTL